MYESFPEERSLTEGIIYILPDSFHLTRQKITENKERIIDVSIYVTLYFSFFIIC